MHLTMGWSIRLSINFMGSSSQRDHAGEMKVHKRQAEARLTGFGTWFGNQPSGSRNWLPAAHTRIQPHQS